MSARPKFVLERFFRGALRGWGIQQSRLGQLQSQFVIEAKGSWNATAKALTLKEIYQFDDGHVDVLEWTIEKQSPTEYLGHETRIHGRAKGRQNANQFNWTYSRRVPAKDGDESTFDFDDTFFLIDKNSLMARASISKLFFEVAHMSVFYKRA